MELSGAPSQLVLPWANGDSSKTSPIPIPSQIGTMPGAASWTDGFPPLCATPVTSGGVPPAKADMNGGLYQMSAIDVWYSAGAGFPYSSGFSSAIGGYPKGARVFMASGLGYWRSLTDNNVTDPDTGGAGWVAEGNLLQTISFSATPTFNARQGNIFEITLTGNVTSSALSNFIAGQMLTFIIHQDATGGRTFVWPTNVNGAATIAGAATATSIQSFIVDGAGIVHPLTPMTVS